MFLLVIPADAVLFCRVNKNYIVPACMKQRSDGGLVQRLTLGPVATPFLRSGISALLGLLALPSRGLEGGAPRLPGVLALRSWTPPSSFALLSVVEVWLLFG